MKQKQKINETEAKLQAMKDARVVSVRVFHVFRLFHDGYTYIGRTYGKVGTFLGINYSGG